MVFWVFGYGSLLWKAGFDYDEKVIGFVKNYRRAFHLGCIQHRGTPELPARVATLVPHEGAVCWGVAYGIHTEERATEIVAYLERRECEYDLKARVDFYTADSPAKSVLSQVLTFTATPEEVNKYYLGPAHFQEIAIQIATAEGPCGYNYEYLFRLEMALIDIEHEEDEVTELANQVRSLLIAGFNVENALQMSELCDANSSVHVATRNLCPAELLGENDMTNQNPLAQAPIDRLIQVSSAA